MRYSFRLAELLGHVPDPRKRPGTIKTIVEYTGLDRHQVAALLKNEVKYIPLKALSRLCDYLIEHGHVPADQLPGALFAVEPENFWEMLARRKRLELCMGVRRDEADNADSAWVVASDSLLLGELLNGVSTLGGTAHHHVMPSGNAKPHPEHIKQTLVWSPFQAEDAVVKERGAEVYREFDHTTSDKALICLGSMKSNPVVELIVSSAFHGTPYVSEDDIADPNDRTVPFYLRFRSFDPAAQSCFGGTSLAAGRDDGPGIYYRKADDTWDCVPWKEKDSDAALVFYLHREAQGRLEMVLCGFSGRATRLLAKMLSSRAQNFWPPTFEGQGLQMGAYILQFQIAPSGSKSSDLLRTDLSASMKVIPIESSVLERRLLTRGGAGSELTGSEMSGSEMTGSEA